MINRQKEKIIKN